MMWSMLACFQYLTRSRERGWRLCQCPLLGSVWMTTLATAAEERKEEKYRCLPPGHYFSPGSHWDNGCCGSQIYGVVTGCGTSHCWGNRGSTCKRLFVSTAFSGGAARELRLRVGNDYHLTLLYLLGICSPIYFPLPLLSLSLHLSVWLVWTT